MEAADQAATIEPHRQHEYPRLNEGRRIRWGAISSPRREVLDNPD